MLIANEGPPRAGKSYDAMLTHVLPALKDGRTVYARLNGLDYEKIAAHLSLPLSRVQELLISVSKEEVVPLFTSFGDDPPRFQLNPDALVIIDEAHDFYVSDRKPLPREQEQFFAKHGHIGLDIVLLTQALGRLHSSLRQRIERKNLFTKLNALGKADRYVVRYYSVGDQMGKFVKISSETKEYDPAIFPLYKGFQPEAKNTGAYTAGSKNVLSTVGKPAVFVALAVIAGAVGIGAFFTGGTEAVVAKGAEQYKGPAKDPAPAAQAVAQPAVAPGQNSTLSVQATPAVVPDPMAGYPVAVKHILDLGRSARPRFSGTIGDRYLLEWRSPQGSALERMTSDQIEAMGWRVVREAYGVVATYQDRSVLFTAWPIDPVFQQTSVQTQRIQEAAGPQPLVKVGEIAAPTAGVVGVGGSILQAPQQSTYGGLGYGGTISDGEYTGPAAGASAR